MGKGLRQEKILEIINSYEVETQEELSTLLIAHNFNVTQATVSRDIKELNLVKVAGKKKKYKYAIIHQNEQKDVYKMFNLFKVSVVSVVAAQNIIVVKTLMGNGLSAGTAIDKMKLPEVVGCVSGDDTVLVVARTSEDAKIVENKLKAQL